MKINFLAILVVILLLGCIYEYFLIDTLKKNHTIVEKIHEDELYQLDFEKSSLMDLVNYSNRIIGTRLTLDTIFVKDLNGESMALGSLIGSTKLILRYSDFHCLACYEQHVLKFKEYIEFIGEENVVFLANYSVVRELFVFFVGLQPNSDTKLQKLKCELLTCNKKTTEYENTIHS